MSTFTQLFNVPQAGMRLNMLDIDTIGNNLANINTDGYKSSRLNFQELLNQATLEGATLAGQQINAKEGALKNTGRNMDWAISGEGYFGIQMENGEVAYTRNGNFQIDGSNKIVTTEGQPLIWSGSIPEGAQAVQIDANGVVTYALNSNSETRYTAGQVSIYRFTNQSGLINKGSSLWGASDASGAAIRGTPNSNGLGTTVGSTLENSNVNLAEEMSHMLIVQRVFQMASRALTQSDTMLTEAIQMRQA